MKPIKIMILGSLLLVIAFVSIRLSFARVFVPDDLEVASVIPRGDEFIRNGHSEKAWKLYKNYLTQKKNIDHIVIESESGYYRNAKTTLSQRMAQILEDPNLPSEIKIEIEVFFKNLNLAHLKNL